MGDYDYLNPKAPPPRPFGDTDTDQDYSVDSIDPANAVVDNSASSPTGTPPQLPSGSAPAVTYYTNVPHPSGLGSGPAIMIYANPVATQPQAADLSAGGTPGSGQIATGQNVQTGSPQAGPSFSVGALSNLTNPPQNIYGVPARPNYVAGNAPDPSVYAHQGEIWKGLMSNPDGAAAGDAAIAYLGSLLNFHRGGALDAQAYGGHRDYGNYTFGVYNAAAGMSLPDALADANLYGRTGQYDPKTITMDPVYTHIPQDNVQNIGRGYSDYANGTWWQKPK